MRVRATKSRSRPIGNCRCGMASVPSVDYLYWPELDLTDGAWLSDRVLVSHAIRPRSFSSSLSALHQGRVCVGIPRLTPSMIGLATCVTSGASRKLAAGTNGRKLL